MHHDWDDGARPPAPDEFHPDNTRRGWVCIALTPVTLALGGALAWLVAYLLDEDLLAGSAPLWVVLACALVALLVAVVAPLAAVVLGRMALRAGDPRGRRPVVAGAVVAGILVPVVVGVALTL